MILHISKWDWCGHAVPAGRMSSSGHPVYAQADPEVVQPVATAQSHDLAVTRWVVDVVTIGHGTPIVITHQEQHLPGGVLIVSPGSMHGQFAGAQALTPHQGEERYQTNIRNGVHFATR